MLNETLQIIQQRRSVRKYKPEQIKDSELQAIYKLPSMPLCYQSQKWHFSVIKIRTCWTRWW